jgi:hypothetical protein
MLPFLACLAAGLAAPNRGKRARLLEDDGHSTPAEVFGIVSGILIWSGVLIFGIIYYAWKCKCYSCCLRKKAETEDTKELKQGGDEVPEP